MPNVMLKMLAVPDLIGLTKGSETDPKEQNENHEGAEVETKAPHGMVPQPLKDDAATDDLKQSLNPGKCHPT